MDELLLKLKKYITELAHNKEFVHNSWFIKWHLEIVEKMSLELCDMYQDADREIVLGLVWMHDYGKLIDRDHQHDHETIEKGSTILKRLGFKEEYIDKLIKYIKIFESKMTEDLSNSPIEIQIVSSSDAASHFVGPFYSLWWYEHSEKSFEELMRDNESKALKDWDRKMVLPEVRKAFESRYKHTMEQVGNLPDKFFS